MNYMLVELSVKCLEGTTERSDGNRVRSARLGLPRTMCLEGTTPQDRLYSHRRSGGISSLKLFTFLLIFFPKCLKVFPIL